MKAQAEPPIRSVRNAFLAKIERSCDCLPYSTILNKSRWLKLKFIPREGARPTVVRVLLPFIRIDRTGSRLTSALRSVRAELFCAHQVVPLPKVARRRAA